MDGTFKVIVDNGYGQTDAELFIQDGSAMIVWYGNGGEEIGEHEIPMSEALAILKDQKHEKALV